MQLIDITLGRLLEDIAQKLPNQDAVIYTDRDFRKTYKEFNELVDTYAKAFISLGIKKDDKVSIWATNIPEWLITLFASAKIGAILVTVNTNYKIFEVEYLLKQSDTHTLIFCDGFKDCNYVEIMSELTKDKDRLPCLQNCIHVGENTPEGMMNWNELIELSKNVTDEELKAIGDTLSPHEVVNMQYTSGTTGFPKGVMLTHYNIINDGYAIGECMKFSEKDRLCIPVPLFHCFGLVLGVMACITHSSSMVPVNYFRPTAVMDAITKEKCTAVHGVPTMFIAMLENPDFDKYDFSSLRTGIMAGSPCPVAVMQSVVDKMNMTEITIAYGLTEASPVCTQTRTDDPLELRVSTVGRTLPFMETKVVNPETGEECPPNVPGEFIVRGYNVMKGYYKMPEATAAIIDKDGWLHSGDLAAVDENGYYKITGRIKDMIIRGGENIYPKEIEEFIYTVDGVQDVQVVGVPSIEYGEEIMAYIIPKEGVTLTEDGIKETVRSNMARHKVPKYVKFIDSFPMTGSGKIQKYKLREMAVEELNLHDANNVVTA